MTDDDLPESRLEAQQVLRKLRAENRMLRQLVNSLAEKLVTASEHLTLVAEREEMRKKPGGLSPPGSCSALPLCDV